MKLMQNKSEFSFKIGTQKENIMHVEYYVLFSSDFSCLFIKHKHAYINGK